MHAKRLLIDLSEASSLHRVTVKLQIDYDKFLDLQNRMPEEYVDRRLAVSLPVTCFDDHEDEGEILAKVIYRRRLAKKDPLQCELTRRNTETYKKTVVRGSVLDYDRQTCRYLVEDQSNDLRQLYYANRLCIQFLDFETSVDLDTREMKDFTLQRVATLRMNIERMLFSEALKLRPDLR